MRNQLIKILLEKFKNNEISKEQVYKILINLDFMSRPSVYECSEVSDEFLQFLGNQTTVIIK